MYDRISLWWSKKYLMILNQRYYRFYWAYKVMFNNNKAIIFLIFLFFPPKCFRWVFLEISNSFCSFQRAVGSLKYFLGASNSFWIPQIVVDVWILLAYFSEVWRISQKIETALEGIKEFSKVSSTSRYFHLRISDHFLVAFVDYDRKASSIISRRYVVVYAASHCRRLLLGWQIFRVVQYSSLWPR